MNVYLNLSDVSCSAFVGDAEMQKTQAPRYGRTNVCSAPHGPQTHTALPGLTHLQALLAGLDTEAGLKWLNCKTQVGEIGKSCNMK